MPNWKRVIVSGSDASLNTLIVSNGITGSLLGTASYATVAANGGVTQLLAGPNITLSPTNGLGQVTVSSTGGSSSFNTATGSYGSFYSTQTQTNVASTARSMSLNVTDISNGVSVSGSTDPYNTYIKTENAGVYDIQFSAQVDKTDSGTDEIWIWLRKNGTNLTDTATSLQLVGNEAHYVAAWNFFVNAAANDYFQLMWYSPDANVRLHAESAFGVVPGIPSLIVTANRVDQFLSNTGSFSGSFTGILTGTASYASQALSSSFASTASYVNTLNQNVIITGSLAVGTSSLGASENTITLGARDSANEGGQIGFNAPGGTYTSASFIDNWQNKIRVLRGSNATSDATVASWDLHTKQMQLPQYTNASSFVGTATANLAVDSGGNVITVSTSGGTVFPYTGNAVVTGSLTATTGFIAPNTNGAMYLRGGDDAELWDINISNHLGVYGQQDQGVASLKLGSGGGILSGRSGSIGIGTINPTSASLTVNGNVWASSFTGSILGTASYASNALSSSFATTASYASNALSASYATSASHAPNIVEIMYFNTTATTLSDATNYTFTTNTALTNTINATPGIPLPIGTVVGWRFSTYWGSAPVGSSETGTLKLYWGSGPSDVTLSTAITWDGNRTAVFSGSLSQAITAVEPSWAFVTTPNFATNPQGVKMVLILQIEI